MSIRLTIFLTAVAFAAVAPAAAIGADPQTVRVKPEPTVTFDGTVQAMAYRGNRIYVGGDFTHAIGRDGKRVARTRLAALDALTGQLLDWSPTADGRVRAIAATDWGVFVGGEFTTVNGVARDSLAQLDLDSGAVTAFKHTMYGQPHTIAVGNGRLYVGGTLTTVDGRTAGRLAAFDLLTGALDLSWRPVASKTVDSILVAGDRIFLGGVFDKINGVGGTAHVAAVDTHGAVRSFRTNVVYAVTNLTLLNGTMYAAVAGRGGRAMAIDAVTGAVRWTVTTDGDVRSVVRLGNTVYIGGHFDHVCASANVGDKGFCLDGSVPRIKLAAVDPYGRLLPWLADANGVVGVETLTASAGLGKFAAGGSFTLINGALQQRFAQFLAS